MHGRFVNVYTINELVGSGCWDELRLEWSWPLRNDAAISFILIPSAVKSNCIGRFLPGSSSLCLGLHVHLMRRDFGQKRNAKTLKVMTSISSRRVWLLNCSNCYVQQIFIISLSIIVVSTAVKLGTSSRSLKYDVMCSFHSRFWRRDPSILGDDCESLWLKWFCFVSTRRIYIGVFPLVFMARTAAAQTQFRQALVKYEFGNVTLYIFSEAPGLPYGNEVSN